MTLKKIKRYSVKECADLLGENEQKIRRYVDDFEIGEREHASNGVEKRVLNEKDFEKLSQIVDLRRAGFTPKSIKLLDENELTIVRKDELSKLQNLVQQSFEKYGHDYIEMKDRLEKLEEMNQKTLEAPAESDNEKDKKIEELSNAVTNLQKEVQEIKTKKIEPIWKRLFSKGSKKGNI